MQAGSVGGVSGGWGGEGGWGHLALTAGVPAGYLLSRHATSLEGAHLPTSPGARGTLLLPWGCGGGASRGGGGRPPDKRASPSPAKPRYYVSFCPAACPRGAWCV